MADAKKDATTSKEPVKEEPAPIPVRAKDTGFYGGNRIRKGTLFTIQSERELGTWMERRDTPEAKALDDAAAALAADQAKFAR